MELIYMIIIKISNNATIPKILDLRRSNDTVEYGILLALILFFSLVFNEIIELRFWVLLIILKEILLKGVQLKQIILCF